MFSFVPIAFLTQHSERAYIRAVTVRTILGRGLVEQDKLPFDLAKESVAQRTIHTGVPSLQGKLRAFVVVERGGNPALDHVAIGADCRVILGRKLARMWFSVAGLTILGCSLELDVVRTGRHLMTFSACHAPVRPFERELRFRMVESAHIGPGAHVMAGFTSQRGAFGAQRRHALAEFPAVGVLVAGGASTVLEMEG